MDAKLRRKRGLTRTGITKLCTEVDAALSRKPVVVQDLKVLLEKLELNQVKIQEQDESVIDSMLNDGNITDADLEKEQEDIDEYLSKMVAAKLKINEELQVGRSTPGSGPSTSRTSTSGQGLVTTGGTGSTHDKKRYTLPKIALGTFNGEIKEWISFWAKFEKIHTDPELHDSDKFQHLAQAMEPGTRGDKIVKSFPMSEANYPKVIKALKDRFGDNNLLADYYMRKLIDLVKEKTGKNSSLVDIYDEVETQLRAMESLGKKPEECALVLFPLIESALPRDTYVAWQRSPLSGYAEEKDFTAEEKLTALLKFLRIEVKSQNRLAVAKNDIKEGKASKSKKADQDKTDSDFSTAMDLYSGSSVKSCIFCEKNHPSHECYQAQKMDFDERRKIVNAKRACFVCLVPGHSAKKCKSKHSCIICGRRHYAITCNELKGLQQSSSKSTSKKENKSESKEAAEAEGGASLTNASHGTVFLQTLMVKVKGSKCTKVARAIIDTGSQRSYVSQKAVEVLGLKSKGPTIVTHNLFGGSTLSQQKHGNYEVEVMDLDEKFTIKLETLDQRKICGFVTRVQSGPWIEELSTQSIKVTDMGDEYRDINLLIGADYAGLLSTGRIYVTKSGPVGVETKLGWTLMGSCPSTRHTSDSSLLVTTLNVNNVDVQDLWKLDLIGIKNNTDSMRREDLVKSASEHFLKTVKVNKDKRYEVCLPWIKGHPAVPVNREIVERKLRTETKKMKAAQIYGQYDFIFKEWEKFGIIEEVNDKEDNCSYIPHRPVIKPESVTTPVRPVFNASIKVKEQPF